MKRYLAPGACLWLVLSGCGGAETKPRTLADIERDLRTLPALYIRDNGKEVLAPQDSNFVMDRESGEIAWLARYCTNPNCPNKDKGQDGRPFLFVWTQPTLIVPKDGSPPQESLQSRPGESYDDFVRRLGGQPVPTCPGCLKLRDLKKETDKQRIQYSDWIKEYIPSEAVKRRQELEAEKKAWEATLKERQSRKMN